MTSTVKDYLLKAPCARCPFRRDIDPYLREDRAREIAAHLRGGGNFSCHKTTVPEEDETGETMLVPGPGNRVCAGALATMEREGQPNQMMRIAERLGLYDAAALKADEQPVYASLTEWVRAHGDTPTVTTPEGEVLEYEHCGVVAEDCEDPAGYGGFGGAYGNDEEPTCNPMTDGCETCGHVACPACRSEQWDADQQLCVYCVDEEVAEYE